MTNDDFAAMLTGLCNLADASKMPDHQQAWLLMLTALAVVDSHYPTGATRVQFLAMAAGVFDQVRSSLASGVPS